MTGEVEEADASGSFQFLMKSIAGLDQFLPGGVGEEGDVGLGEADFPKGGGEGGGVLGWTGEFESGALVITADD